MIVALPIRYFLGYYKYLKNTIIKVYYVLVRLIQGIFN